MRAFNICILGYNNNFKKFLDHIKDKKTKYNLKLIEKKTNPKNLDFNELKNRIIKKKVNILAICNKNFIPLVSNNIAFFLKKKIKVVQSSNNSEVENHGFIIEKPFRDFSFEELFLRKTLQLKFSKKSEFIREKKILITGGAGSIGSGLVKKLISHNVKKIFVIDNNEYNIFKLRNSLDIESLKKIKFYLTNIDNKKMLYQTMQEAKPEIVFHAAALKHVIFLEKNIQQGILTNVIGTKNILDISKNTKVKYFIHISTDKAADPKSVLGYTKLLSEYVCHNFISDKMKIGIVRFGNVFNSYGSAAESFKNQIINTEKIRLSHPRVERFFMSNLEATNLIISSLKFISEKNNNNKCRTFVCDMGKPIKIRDLVVKMLFLSGRSPNKNISKSFYGLKNTEKISEILMSKNEKISKILNERIFEITKHYKKVNFSKIQNLIYSSKNSKILKNQLRRLI